MSSDSLENLVRIEKLKREAPRSDELEGLLHSGQARLKDAGRGDLTYESRFDLAYNASHALALYALRRKGYRPEDRYIVFQLLPETAGLPMEHARVMAKAHDKRNLAEYEGYLEPDERLLDDLLIAARKLLALLL
jgi:hypothetical protein